ncbi:MAG: PEP-CTERM sorting domain-containing protein, partial [Kiritimatiellia bacterium]
LAIGETLTLNFDITFYIGALGKSGDDGFRFGIYDSNSDRVTADNTNANGSAAGFNDDRGYSVWANLNESGNLELFEKTSDNNLNVSSSANTQRATGTNTNMGTGGLLSTAGSFSIERTASGLNISSSIGGGSVSYSHLSPGTTEFDTIYFFGAGTQFTENSNDDDGSFTLDNVSVSVIPEPSTFILVGLALLGLVAFGHRK